MKKVCSVCGALWKGKEFVELHYFPCANNEYGWASVIPVPDSWVRPQSPHEKPDTAGIWNRLIIEKNK